MIQVRCKCYNPEKRGIRAAQDIGYFQPFKCDKCKCYLHLYWENNDMIREQMRFLTDLRNKGGIKRYYEST